MQVERRSGWPQEGVPGLAWLGQAGFWIQTERHRILIDPYLSNSLAAKYADRGPDHRRLMPVPIAVADLPRPDAILVTHAHTDHLDPDTLGPLAARFPGLVVVAPAACADLARARAPGARIVGALAGERIEPTPGLLIDVTPAAHERREQDGQGRDLFLGYALEAGGVRLWHSGDCVPFDGLPEAVGRADVALLPVNGRDARRAAMGVPGNFHPAEAVHLARALGAAVLVPHHWGLFAFNSADPAEVRLAAGTGPPTVVVPQPGETLCLAR